MLAMDGCARRGSRFVSLPTFESEGRRRPSRGKSNLARSSQTRRNLLGVSAGHNLEEGTDCGFTGAGDKRGVDPLLGPLQDNGGQSDTRALAAGSPALDAADNATCPSTDQRGVSRPQTATCDFGAFELVPACNVIQLS